MIKIPKFLLYGQDDPTIEKSIQPSLALRRWSDLSTGEKEIAFQEINNSGWLKAYSEEILGTIKYLNHVFLRQCPGKHLHGISPERDGYRGGGYINESYMKTAASVDFRLIFLQEESEGMVLRMLSKFAESHIDSYSYQQAAEPKNKEESEKCVRSAFEDFDRFANCLNHIFEQFSVNQIITRNGFVPRQDEKIISEIYIPTLKVLANPKWKTVSNDLARMFEDYRDGNYPEVITKA
ncbi:MAG: hypothetical protein Q8O66_02800, partial [bacterium]|nr:hypothetical protein [bacterium]